MTIAPPEARSLPAATPSGSLTAEVPKPAQPAAAVAPPPARSALSAPGIVLQERYFTASELDVIPKIQQDLELYPEELQHYTRGGKLVIRLWIDETGHVEKAEMASSELPAFFSEVVLQRFMQASFFPGKRNNSAVKSRVEAVLAFPSHDLVN